MAVRSSHRATNDDHAGHNHPINPARAESPITQGVAHQRASGITFRNASSTPTPTSRKFFDTTDEWIVSRTGMHERHYRSQTSEIDERHGSRMPRDMAIERAGLAARGYRLRTSSRPLRRIISVPRHRQRPGRQTRHAVGKPAAFDIEIACSGFIYGLTARIESSMRVGRVQTRACSIGSRKAFARSPTTQDRGDRGALRRRRRCGRAWKRTAERGRFVHGLAISAADGSESVAVALHRGRRARSRSAHARTASRQRQGQNGDEAVAKIFRFAVTKMIEATR